MAQQLQTSTSSPTTSVQTPELVTVERTDFHELPTTSTGILLHTHAFMYAHRIIVIINKIRRKKKNLLIVIILDPLLKLQDLSM